MAGIELEELLACHLNYMISRKTVSIALKEGKHPKVFIKEDPSDPENRRITVTQLLLKILEHIVNKASSLSQHNKEYKKGFTPPGQARFNKWSGEELNRVPNAGFC